MTSLRAISLTLSLVAATISAMTPTASAQSQLDNAQFYPEKPLKVIVPFPAGGPLDSIARLVAYQMSLKLKQPVVVENLGGAGGTLGTATAAAAEPDGYTLLWGSVSTLAIAPALYKTLRYDPTRFVPVAQVAQLPIVLVVRPEVPANTVEELVAHMRANPGKLNFGAALGTPTHLISVLFKDRTGVDANYIPYKGGAPMIADILGGQIHFTFEPLTSLDPLIKDGKLRPLAIVNPTRWPLLPNVPTMAERGFADFTAPGFIGVLAPPGTPSAVVDKLNAAINEGLASAEVKASLEKLSAVTQIGSPSDFAHIIQNETPKWREMVRISGASVQ